MFPSHDHEGGNEAIGMCFLSPAANDVEQTIAFGDSNNNQSGKIQYEHANDAMHLDTGGTERLRIDSGGRVQIGGVTGPNNAKLFVAGTNSTNYLTFRNTSASDSDGGRWNNIRFQGTQSGGEVSTLTILQANHDGSSDDEKGNFEVLINDGNDGDSLPTKIRVDSDGLKLGS